MHDMSTLRLMVGLPRSGKTTHAKMLGCPIVCPDAIRYALHGKQFLGEAEDMVWCLAKYMVKSLFLAGHGIVVVDACHATRKRREFWKSSQWNRVYTVIGGPEMRQICHDRVEPTDDPGLVDAINRMADQWEPVEKDETRDYEGGMSGSEVAYELVTNIRTARARLAEETAESCVEE